MGHDFYYKMYYNGVKISNFMPKPINFRPKAKKKILLGLGKSLVTASFDNQTKKQSYVD